MTYESKTGIDSGLKYRITHNDEQTVRDKGALPNAVSFSNGEGVYNGSTSYMNIDNALGLLRNTTVGTWKIIAKPTDSTPAAQEFFLSFTDEDDINEGIFLLLTGTTLRAQFVDDIDQLVKWRLDVDVNPLLDGEWATIVLSHDGTEPSLYINGVKPAQTFLIDVDRTKWFSDAPEIDNGRIGNRNIGSTEREFLNGSIDLVEIYDYARTAEQVANDYNNSTYRDISPEGLVLDIDSRLGVIKDSLGSSLTVNGTEVKRSGVFTSMYFDGASNVVWQDYEINGWSEITVNAFVRHTGGINERVVCKDQVGVQGAFILWVGNLGYIAFQANNGSGYILASDGSTSISDGLWHMVTGVIRSGNIYIYVDGVEIYSTAFSGTIDDSENEEIVIGSDSDIASPEFYWNGNIDNVKIHNYGLSAAEIMQLYTNQKHYYA